MTEKITRRKLSDRHPGKTDWARVDAMTDEEIERNIGPDDAPITNDFSKFKVVSK